MFVLTSFTVPTAIVREGDKKQCSLPCCLQEKPYIHVFTRTGAQKVKVVDWRLSN